MSGNWPVKQSISITSAATNPVDYSPSGTYVAIASDQDVEIRNQSDYSLVTTLTQSGGSIEALAFSRDGNYVAYSSNQDIWIHSVGGGWSLEDSFSDALGPIQGIDFDPNNNYMAYCWTGFDQDSNVVIRNQGSWTKETELTRSTDNLSDVKFGRNNNYIAYAGSGLDDTVYIDNVGTWSSETTLTRASDGVLCLEFTEDNSYILYGSSDSNVYIDNVGTWSSETTLLSQAASIADSISVNNEFVAYSGSDTFIHRLSDWSLAKTLNEGSDNIDDLDFDPSNDEIGYSNDDNTFYVHGVDYDSPTVVTNAATEVGADKATLNGELTSIGDYSSVDVFFRYRETGATEWIETGTQTLSSAQIFDGELTGLSQSTDYEFKAVVSYSDQEDEATTETFTTSSLPLFSGKVVDSNDNSVEGADVVAINDTTSTIEATDTTDINGDYNFEVEETNNYHLSAQYEDGSGNQFNAVSKPYVTADQDRTGLDFALNSYTAPDQNSVDFDLTETSIDPAVSTSYDLDPRISQEINDLFETAIRTGYSLQPETSAELNNAFDTATATGYILTPETSNDFENFEDSAIKTGYVLAPETSTEVQVNIDSAVKTSYVLTPETSTEEDTNVDTTVKTAYTLASRTSSELNNAFDTATATGYILESQTSTEDVDFFESAVKTGYSLESLTSTDVKIIIEEAETTSYQMVSQTSSETIIIKGQIIRLNTEAFNKVKMNTEAK